MKNNLLVPVQSIFNSISGEVGLIPQGAPTTFLRLAGCNLRCAYCDSMDAVLGKNKIDLSIDVCSEVVMEHVRTTSNLIITGGEPLLNQEVLDCLLERIGYKTLIQIETNGTIIPRLRNLSLVDCWVIDYKHKETYRGINLSPSYFVENFLQRLKNTLVIMKYLLDVDMVEYYHYFGHMRKIVSEGRSRGLSLSDVVFAIGVIWNDHNGTCDDQHMLYGKQTQRLIDKLLCETNFGVRVVLNTQLHKLLAIQNKEEQDQSWRDML